MKSKLGARSTGQHDATRGILRSVRFELKAIHTVLHRVDTFVQRPRRGPAAPPRFGPESALRVSEASPQQLSPLRGCLPGSASLSSRLPVPPRPATLAGSGRTPIGSVSAHQPKPTASVSEPSFVGAHRNERHSTCDGAPGSAQARAHARAVHQFSDSIGRQTGEHHFYGAPACRNYIFALSYVSLSSN